MDDDPGRSLVEVVDWRGGRPVRLRLTDRGRRVAAASIPRVNTHGLEYAARRVGLPPRRLQVLLALYALSGSGGDAEVEVTDPPEENA